MSLYSYENDVIRALGDPRVHFALNCMPVGCPRLPMTPFNAASLDDELDRETRRFMAETRNVRVDSASRTVWCQKYSTSFLKIFWHIVQRC